MAFSSSYLNLATGQELRIISVVSWCYYSSNSLWNANAEEARKQEKHFAIFEPLHEFFFLKLIY